MMQRAMINFMAKPKPALAPHRAAQHAVQGQLPVPEAQADYGVKVMKEDGLVSTRGRAASARSTLDRNTRMINILRPIYTAQRQNVPGDLTADAIATNEYIDPSIRMGSLNP